MEIIIYYFITVLSTRDRNYYHWWTQSPLFTYSLSIKEDKREREKECIPIHRKDQKGIGKFAINERKKRKQKKEKKKSQLPSYDLSED
jgi:hypothetical protein